MRAEKGLAVKWVTRERARVDRIACPWLLRRFIDPDAEILWVPSGQVESMVDETGAIPFDVPGVEYGHHGSECSFDAFIRLHRLDSDPALVRLAVIVRAADTDNKGLAPESRGLEAIATGFWAMNLPDRDSLNLQMPVYDALYLYCGGNRSNINPSS